MANICPGCNKFASLETQDPEVDDLEVDAGGHVTCSVRLVRVSECCGEEMKETTFDLENDAVFAAPDGMPPIVHEGDGHELSVEETASEVTERSDGKPGTPSRYRKTYHGVRVEATVTCACGATADVELSDELQASAFDDLT